MQIKLWRKLKSGSHESINFECGIQLVILGAVGLRSKFDLELWPTTRITCIFREWLNGLNLLPHICLHG